MGLSGHAPEAASLVTAMLALVDTLVDDVDIVEMTTLLIPPHPGRPTPS